MWIFLRLINCQHVWIGLLDMCNVFTQTTRVIWMVLKLHSPEWSCGMERSCTTEIQATIHRYYTCCFSHWKIPHCKFIDCKVVQGLFFLVKTPALCKNSLSSLHVHTCRNHCVLGDRFCCQLQFLKKKRIEYTWSSDYLTGFTPEDEF